MKCRHYFSEEDKKTQESLQEKTENISLRSTPYVNSMFEDTRIDPPCEDHTQDDNRFEDWVEDLYERWLQDKTMQLLDMYERKVYNEIRRVK